ncbi:hypothetical protein [Streptomyces sp. NBC_00620]|uniref:hypothetical protein n=1 Tax=Streptomyces sp. NBC_00620 TaxID=2903666 RepID=UPI002259F57A|nr:hypothetical protein [Streptomyces sp. NBC_00620]MCX4972171.1 hypothetical protein [Streptomyces sp. NBC_00620]
MLLATAAACGTVQNLTAGQKVDQAVDRLGEQKSLAFELDLDADSDALTALAGEAGSEEELPPEFAKLLAGLRVEVSVKSKKPLADSGEKDLVGMSARVEGPEGVLVEYRVVGDFTYYRADFKAMGETMGVPMPTADQIPESEKEFRKVLEGEWVKVDTSALEKAQKSESSSGGADGIDAKTQQKIIDAVRGVIAHEVTFSAKDGSDGTEHVIAQGNFRDLLTGVLDKLGPLEGDLPPGAELPTAKDLKDAPNKKVAVDFTLKNGDLTQVEVDLAVLADAPKGTRLPLVLKFTDAGDVSAPSGATEIPTGMVPGDSLFSGGLLGGGEF